MNKILSFFLFTTLFSAFIYGKDGYPRNTSIDVIHYEFSLSLNDSTNCIYGETRIIARFLNHSDSILFDLSGMGEDGRGMIVTNVTFSGKPTGWTHKKNKLTIQTGSTVTASAEICIIYSGIPSDGLIISRNKFGSRVFFSDHWPDRAHNYLPCMDHPYDKASVDFKITAPARYRVVANGVYSGEWFLKEDAKCTHWKEVVPLPVKVMAFGAAVFAVNDTAKVDNIPVSTWVYPENQQEGFFDYSVAWKPLDFYIRSIGEYPYKKLANVQSKTIYGGLENAGTIFYAERSVTGKGLAESLIAHEIAHQWYGNSVTENDWHHVWLSEGFATYLTSMYFEEVKGKEALSKDLDSTRARVIRYYRKNKMPVIDTTVTDLMQLLNTNTYQKGAWVLHMLRQKIGDEAFKDGLRLFYDRFRNSNVVTEDFLTVMEEASGTQLDDFFRQWLYTGGHPELKISYKKGRRKTVDIIVEQLQEKLFEFPLELSIIKPGGEQLQKIQISERLTKMNFPGKVLGIRPDPDVKLLFARVGK